MSPTTLNYTVFAESCILADNGKKTGVVTNCNELPSQQSRLSQAYDL